MEKSIKTAALIPVRGGSKSIPLKNIKSFFGKPLVYWAVAAAVQCKEIDHVYVATDDNRIRETIEGFELEKVTVINRSEESATDQAPTEIVLVDFGLKTNAERIVLIQATSPLLTADDLSEALRKLDFTGADSLVSVVRQKRFIWSEMNGSAFPINYDPSQRPRRQDWEGYYVENGAFYITSREKLITSHCRISGSVTLYEMPEATYFEIDEPTDWTIVEKLKGMEIEKSHGDATAPVINLLISDVDGVLTDAGMYYSTNGEELKKFNTRDGKGIELLRQAGVKVMFLTAENIEVVRARGKKLNVDFLFMGIKDKKSFLDQFFHDNPEFSFQTTAYIGDDINDLDCLKASILSAAPQDAHPKVKGEVSYVCNLGGGQGCVREISDYILSLQG